MNRRIFTLILVTALIMLTAFGCADDSDIQEDTPETSAPVGENEIIDESATETESPEIFTSMPDDIWNSANIEYSGFSSKDEFLEEAKYCIAAISEFTSRKAKWYDIEYRLTDEMSYTDGNGDIVYLKKDFFEHDLAPIVNVTARLICPNENSTSLHEGLVSYCQDMFGKNPSIHNYGLDADAWANLLLIYYPDQFDTLFPDIGTAEIKNTLSYNELRQFYCLLCSSFTKYLINNYGIDNFMLLYESDDLENDYENICGVPLDNIKTAWRQEIEKYSEPISPEELQAYLQELHISHNYPLE